MNTKFIEQVADQVTEYAAQYRCSLADSLYDWEGNGPEGSFGLQLDEKAAVATELRARGFDTINVTPPQAKRYEGTPESDEFDLAGSVDVWTLGPRAWVGHALPPCFDEVNHSPTGFAWNYGGSGPAQLAYAILRDFSDSADTARRHYQAFKVQIVAQLPRGAWKLEGKVVAEFLGTVDNIIDCDASSLDDAGVEDLTHLDREQVTK